jgi:5-carboxymethyl-2-hydroxymuconate isomerase
MPHFILEYSANITVDIHELNTDTYFIESNIS